MSSQTKAAAIQFLANASILSTFTYIPIFAGNIGITDIGVTYLVAGYAFAAFITNFVVGRLADVRGRRLFMKIGLILSAISFALIPFASNFYLLFAIRVFNGFAIGIYPAALTAYVYEQKMTMGRFAGLGSLGWGVGTFIAGLIAKICLNEVFGLASLFFILAFLISLKLEPIDSVRIKVPLFPKEVIKRNWHVYAALFARHSTAFAIWTLWPLFLYNYIHADLFWVGIIQTTNMITQAVFMFIVTDHFRPRPLIYAGLFLSAVSFYSFTLAWDVITILPTQIVLGASWAFLYVGVLKYLTDYNKERATATGILGSILSLSNLLGPFIASILYATYNSYLPSMYLASIVSLIALFIFIPVAQRRKHLETFID